MPKIIQKNSKIIFNARVTANYFRLVFDLSEIAKIALPGQFVMLRVSGGCQPLLRRPFGIHRVGQKPEDRRQKTAISGLSSERRGLIEILYEVVGKGTEILSQKKAGEYVDVLGPLGNGYPIPDTRYSILVGGGIGIAPLLFLAEQASIRYPESSIRVLIGAKTKKEILSKKKFASLGCDVRISTDDASDGFKGRVTDLLRNILAVPYRPHSAGKKPAVCGLRPETVIYACGPKPMLEEISAISKKYGVPAQVSLDEYMACGLGVCLGCMIKTRDGQMFVCKDGPVFDASRINL
ncbi:MAG: dihydroorotate dehydrogenase electron transfer subunit [Candidatus Omnitrophota bacterium]